MAEHQPPVSVKRGAVPRQRPHPAVATRVLATGYHPHHSPPDIGWTAITAGVMFALAAGKARTGAALNNPVLTTEGRSHGSTGCWPPPFCSA